jgi:hypothetical protein
MWKEKSFFYRESNSDPSAVQPVAMCYTASSPGCTFVVRKKIRFPGGTNFLYKYLISIARGPIKIVFLLELRTTGNAQERGRTKYKRVEPKLLGPSYKGNLVGFDILTAMITEYISSIVMLCSDVLVGRTAFETSVHFYWPTQRYNPGDVFFVSYFKLVGANS